MNRDPHDGDPIRAARGILSGVVLSIIFFWLPLGVAVVVIVRLF